MIQITICIQEFFEGFFIIARLGPRSRCVLYMGRWPISGQFTV